MDTGGCAAAAAQRVVDPAPAAPAPAPAPTGAKKRPDMTDGWTGTKKNKTPCSREYQAHGLEGGGSGDANSTAVVVRPRKRPYPYTELELAIASSSEKMFKCNYWEDPAYAKRLEYFGLRLARSAALDNNCDRLLSRQYNARMAGAAATPASD